MSGYLDALDKGVSLALFDGGRVIFTSGGKWLHPLFEAEEFLRSSGPFAGPLCLHDSISGLAAAYLTIRLGVSKVNIDMVSDLALELYAEHGIEVHYTKRVERIKCITETLIRPDMSLEEAYRLLRKKADLTSGLSLRLEHLSFSYGDRRLLEDVDLYLEKGDAVILEGDNGSGKSTLLRLILGLETPDDGRILFDGETRRPPIGYIRQFSDRQNFPFTSWEVVALGLPDGVEDRRAEIELALRRCGVYHLKDRCFFSLSGGEMAKVNLARVLASKACLLLFDEPVASLDRDSRIAFADIMTSLSVTEMPTMIIVNHDRLLREALPWPVRRLEGGRLV